MRVGRLADLKRLPVGTRLRLVECLMGPVSPDRQERAVYKVQTNAIAFERPGTTHLSWLQFPKATDFQVTADGFAVLEDGKVAARYVLEEEINGA